MTREQITRQIQGVLERVPEFQLAILYGSVARDAHRRDSDVDLAVVADARIAIKGEILLDISLQYSWATGREVQVRDLARAQGLFLKQVLTPGRSSSPGTPRSTESLLCGCSRLSLICCPTSG